MRIILAVFTAAITAAILSGCCSLCDSKVAIHMKQAPLCKPVDSLLKACDSPKEIKEGITYEDLIQLMADERSALSTCRDRQMLLANTIQVCNEEISKTNKRLQEIMATSPK